MVYMKDVLLVFTQYQDLGIGTQEKGWQYFRILNEAHTDRLLHG